MELKEKIAEIIMEIVGIEDFDGCLNAEVLKKQVDGYADKIMEEIRKRRPVKIFPDELPGEVVGDFTSRKIRNQTIDIYDKTLGVYEDKKEGK